MQGESVIATPSPPPVEASLAAAVHTAASAQPPRSSGFMLTPLRRKPPRPGARERRRARRLRALRLPLMVLMFLAVATMLVVARSLIIPLVLAAFVGMGLNPIVAGLQRIYVPRALGALAVMAVLIAGVVEAVSLFATPAMKWIAQAPQAFHQLEPKLKHMLRPLSQATHAATQASQSLVGAGAAQNAPAPATTPAFSAGDVLQATPAILAETFTVVLLVFFFLTYGDHMRRRLASASPRFAYRRIALKLVRGIQLEISRYLLTVTLINACLGAITAAILWFWQMPDPVLWGCVVALLNYMPYLGAITSTLLLCAVGLLHFDSPGHALLPALCFAILAAMEGNVITPMIMGHRLRLSPLAILIWLLIWGWMWGIPGALLAVPMLTCAKLITERVPGLEWFALMVER